MEKDKNVVVDSYFQVVVLADQYDTKSSSFGQLADLMPNILIPIGGVPLINFTIQWLINNKVPELFLVYTKHKEIIENHFKNTKYDIQINLIFATEATSVGDAIRELTLTNKITEEFMLMFGDTITNLKFENLAKFRQQHLKEDKLNVLTCVLQKKLSEFSNEEQNSYVINQNQLLQFEQMNNKKIFEFNTERIKFGRGFSQGVTVYNQYQDSGIYFCSIDILKAFTEQFENHHLKEDLINELLTSEISEEKISVILLEPTEFCQRANNFFNLKKCFQMILSKQVKSISLKKLFPSKFLNYSKESQTYYGNQKLNQQISQSIIANDVQIHENNNISNSIIGENVKIGQNVKLTNSILMSGCTIEDNVEIINSIIFNDKKIVISIDGKVYQSQDNIFDNYVSIQTGKKDQEDDFEFQEEEDEEEKQSGEDQNVIQYRELVIEILEPAFKDAEAIDSAATDILNVSKQGILNKLFIENEKDVTSEQTIDLFLTKILEFYDSKEFKGINEILAGIQDLVKSWTVLFAKFLKAPAHYQAFIQTIVSEILTQDSILDWHKAEQGTQDALIQGYMKNLQQFIEYLQKSEEEDDDEDDD